jgi:regulator of cell morphogenesis and NO signaling
MTNQSPSLPVQEETVQILQRYNVSQAHNLIYTYEELRNLNITPKFILTLLDVFEDQRSFNPGLFDNFTLEMIVDYLHKTHTYYQTKKLPEIEQSIHLLVNAYPRAHPMLLLLNTFYNDYKNHLNKHIEMEEQELMPYIVNLERAALTKNKNLKAPTLTVERFINQHHDTEKDLEEVRTAILHYSPPEGNQTLYRILLSQLQIFEKDLSIHALIEDEVLLPRALALEKQNAHL